MNRAAGSVFAALALLLFAGAPLAACTKSKAPDATHAPSATASATAAPPAPASASGAAPGASGASSAATSLPKNDVFPTAKGDLVVTPIHHATLLFTYAGKAVYLDPTKDGHYEGLPKADYVFVTDIHGDHMDPDGLALVKKATTVVVGPPAVGEKMPLGVTLKNGDTKDFGDFSALAVPMYNLTRGPTPGKLFHDKGRGDGYVFTFADKRVYVSGDTECTEEMRTLQKIDVAFVCMNLPYTMPPAEAAACVNAFKPKVVFPYHYRDSNLAEFTAPVERAHSSDVRLRTWY